MWNSDQCKDMEALRISFHKVGSENELLDFIKTYENSQCMYSLPYLASAHMQQAEYTLMPNRKLKYFLEGKRKLESYIELYPLDIEGRYVRFLVQSNLPSFLGYSGDIVSDKEYIRRNLDSASLSESYKRLIVKTMNKLNKE